RGPAAAIHRQADARYRSGTHSRRPRCAQRTISTRSRALQATGGVARQIDRGRQRRARGARTLATQAGPCWMGAADQRSTDGARACRCGAGGACAVQSAAGAVRIAKPRYNAQVKPLVGIIMGSTSDWETMQAAAELLDKLGIAHE